MIVGPHLAAAVGGGRRRGLKAKLGQKEEEKRKVKKWVCHFSEASNN
jgi:hypothetical protein